GEGTAAEAATSIGLAVGRGDAAAVEAHGDGGERHEAGAVNRDAAAHRAFARGHAEAWVDREGAGSGVLRAVRDRHGAEPSGLNRDGEPTVAEAAVSIGGAGRAARPHQGDAAAVEVPGDS